MNQIYAKAIYYSHSMLGNLNKLGLSFETYHVAKDMTCGNATAAKSSEINQNKHFHDWNT